MSSTETGVIALAIFTTFVVLSVSWRRKHKRIIIDPALTIYYEKFRLLPLGFITFS